MRSAGHIILDGSPCAASTRVAPKDILHTVSAVQLHIEKPEVLAQAKEGVKEIDYVNMYGMREGFNTNDIHGLGGDGRRGEQ